LSKAGEPRRLFFSLWPDDALRDRLVAATDPLLAGKRARKTHPANLHLTLAFLGGVPPEALDAVIAAGDQVRASQFELTFDRVESWRAAHVACIAIDPVPSLLAALVAQLRAELAARQVPVDLKDFRAHITLARDWRDGRLDARIAPLSWPVQEFVLVESNPGPKGSEYSVLHRWPLERSLAS
jgi:2'-5' RNA ligase